MARTLINGSEEIQGASIPWSAMASGAIVPLAAIVNNSQILLSTGAVSMGAALNLGGFTAQNSGSPVNATDLVTKAYVDAKSGGIGGIHDVRFVVASNQASLSGLSAQDGVTPVAGDVGLLINQTTASQNGPWTFGSGAWTRPTWWASASTVNEGQYFMAAEGTTYKDTKFWCTTTGTITVDTTATAFSQDLSGAIYTASTGLTLTGGAFSVNYGTTSTTAAVGNDSRITGALQTASLGTSVQTALGVAVGSAGSVVVNGGALGTPGSGTLTSCTGLPIGGIAGLGTGVGSALAIAVGTAGGPITNGGALGTPSGGSLANCSSLPISGIAGLGSGVAAALAVAANANGGALLAGAAGYLQAAAVPAFSSGDVTSAGGTLTLTVNNTSGSGFVKYTNFIWNETPGGSMNGSNTTFTLANTPANSGAALELCFNGRTLEPGSGNDFTISGSTITMLFAPASTDKLRAYYIK